MITFLKKGLLTTVQDLGRTGYQRFGMPVCGAMDPFALELGNMEEVRNLLGYDYYVTGKIIHGRRLGRTIGVPTINQIPPQDKLLPPFGVYYSDVEIGGELYHGMTNIGVKPTIGDDRFREGAARLTAETYLYNFDGDLYGTEARTMLREFRRPERKFGSLEELRHAMDEDIRAGEQLFACL